MKKFLMALPVILSGCAGMGLNEHGSSATQIGTALFQTAVKQKCQSEIKNNQYYKVASVIMTNEQQNKITDSVCGCVSEKAPQSMTMTELATAAIDSSARTRIVTKAVSNTLQACVSEFVK